VLGRVDGAIEYNTVPCLCTRSSAVFRQSNTDAWAMLCVTLSLRTNSLFDSLDWPFELSFQH
jgi:hypothetical protein